MTEPIVQQCRGMVVDTKARRVVAWPYDKFWNVGEPGAAAIDWSTAQVLEKLDGSLMILYFHDAEWMVASSGQPTAGGSYGMTGEGTYRDAFWRTFRGADMRLPNPAWGEKLGVPLEGYCFMFELCAPDNRIVVRYDKPRLVLHGARFIATGRELGRDGLQLIALEHHWPLVDAWPMPVAAALGEAGCVKAADDLDPVATEGFIVVDAAFRRVKIKSPRYVMLHKMKDGATPRGAIRLWQNGEASELLSVFPEFAPLIEPVHERLNAIARQAFVDTLTHRRATASRKDFAAAIGELPHAAVCFKLYPVPEPAIADAERIMRAFTLPALERLADLPSLALPTLAASHDP